MDVRFRLGRGISVDDGARGTSSIASRWGGELSGLLREARLLRSAIVAMRIIVFLTDEAVMSDEAVFGAVE